MELFGSSNQAGLSIMCITAKSHWALLIRLQIVFKKRGEIFTLRESLPKALILRNGCSFTSKLKCGLMYNCMPRWFFAFVCVICGFGVS